MADVVENQLKAPVVAEAASISYQTPADPDVVTPPPPMTDKEPPTRPFTPSEELEKSSAKKEGEVDVVTIETEEPKPSETHKLPPQNLVSFKEESNKLVDLSDFEQKALQELKNLVQEALDNHRFTPPAPPLPEEAAKLEEEKQTAQSSTGPTSDVTPPPPPTATTEVPSSESEIKPLIPPTHEPIVDENAPEKAAEVVESASTELPIPETQKGAEDEVKVEVLAQEVSIWGVPLLKDDRSDVILLKFLRAREFKVKEAFIMIKNTLQWRKDNAIDALVDEDLGDDLDKVVFMHGHDRDGHPVCYNVYSEFQNKDLYQKTFSDAEKRMKFLRWRIQFLERSIRKLDFSPGGVCTIVQVNDLKNTPGPGKRELRLATRQALQLLQDNYPEFVAKQVFVNVPWWYVAFYTMMSPFLTQRTKSKFVFCSPMRTAETLFKYISPGQVPLLYGGLSVDSCDCNPEFSIDDPVSEVPVKPATKHTVDIIIYEKCIIVWELRVVGWEVSYGAEFVPDAKDAYTVIIQKPTKMAPTDEPVVHNGFRVAELGKIRLSIDNPTSKKKKLLYRFKIKPLAE